jgi:isocitrate/isopropylmalate dehydrogenase
MPIPSFTEQGLLPEGVHDCTLAEVAARFGAFQTTDQRPRLYARLHEFVAELRAAKLVPAVIIDGSFVTAKPTPGDVDLILLLPADYDEGAELRPAQYNVLSKRRVRARYGLDVLVVREQTTAYEQSVAFFAQVRGHSDRRKGLVRVQL